LFSAWVAFFSSNFLRAKGRIGTFFSSNLLRAKGRICAHSVSAGVVACKPTRPLPFLCPLPQPRRFSGPRQGALLVEDTRTEILRFEEDTLDDDEGGYDGLHMAMVQEFKKKIGGLPEEKDVWEEMFAVVRMSLEGSSLCWYKS
jgi:hypothetical protein